MPRLAKVADRFSILLGNERWEHSGGLYWLTGNHPGFVHTLEFTSDNRMAVACADGKASLVPLTKQKN